MNVDYEAKKAEKERKLQLIEDTSIFLGQVGALLKTRQFQNWLKERNGRFQWATNELFDRLDRDLSFQVGQALPMRARDSRNMPLGKALHELGSLCADLSDDLIHRFGLKVTKKERKVKLDERFTFSDYLYQWLSHRPLNRLAREEGNGFYIWNALNQLVSYVRARETLERDTGNPKFEYVLANLELSYLLSGYPFDVLAHDAHEIRHGVPVKAIILRNSYCSSYLIHKDDKAPADYGEDCQVIPFSSKSA